MSISSGYDKFKDYHQTDDGSYKLTSRWTSSNTVELDDGSTVEEKFTETDSKLSENTENIENLNAHASNKTNPHSVTKSQVGLGNVPNVATNDQTPTYNDTTTFATLTSGEKLGVAMAKIKLAITNLINHIANKSNPHGVTKSQVGLGNVDNTSDTDKPISTATQAALDTINSSLNNYLPLSGGEMNGILTAYADNITPLFVKGTAEASINYNSDDGNHNWVVGKGIGGSKIQNYL